ncbi:hypothetical protein [Paraburkholderia sp. 32]|uniref:hypothetical protein n=1 Tax=Paraburkholderia sp. 32 TaxID=2991057 RepID=UPI003D21C263
MGFREHVRRQASKARREMVRNGTLLGEPEFRALLGVGERRLASLVAAGSLFSIDVDGLRYFPAVLGDPGRDCTRLYSLCRILVPAPSASRLDFLESRQGSLGGLSPLDALGDSRLYRSVRAAARAWAAECSRTIVKIFIGRYLEEPEDVAAAHMAVDEVDPRTDLWKRALGALQADGYISPPRMLPQAYEATVFITRNAVGNRPAVLEARIALKVTSHLAHIEVSVPGMARGDLSVPLAASDNVVDVVLQTVEAIRRSDGQPD